MNAPRLSQEQWQALHWLASPTAYVSGGGERYAALLPRLVRQDAEGRWRSTVLGRKALAAHPIWVALAHAAETGSAFLWPKAVAKLAHQGLVEEIPGSHYPTLERRFRLTNAGATLVAL